MMPKQLAHTSPGSVLSLRGGAPGSPAAIVARLKDGVIGYKALAALPRDKAILDIERPDLMMYEPHYSYSPLLRSLSPRSLSPPASPERPPVADHPDSFTPPRASLGFQNLSKESRDWPEIGSHGESSPGSTQPSRTSSTLTPTTPTTPNATNTTNAQNAHPVCAKSAKQQHFHRPENGSNIYKKPPIYRHDVASSAVPQGKHIEDLIIASSKFPAAQRPDPDQPSKIETDHWPCPPSLAVIEKESRKKDSTNEDEEAEDKLWDLRALQKQELNKIQSNLGKIILKEELECSAAPLRRKARSLPDKGSASRAQHFPASSGSSLCRLQSEEFSSSKETAPGLQNGELLKERGNSLPSMLENKVFPYQVLVQSHQGRRRLPPDVDGTRLESYLSQQDFLHVFGMSQQDFYSLSLWRRNELKKKFGLF